MLAGLLLGLLLAVSAEAEPWRYEIGPELPGLFYSVGHHLTGLGVPVGQYGGGTVALIDPVTAGWRVWARLPVGPGHESISVLQEIDIGAGLNAWTESDAGAQCWTAWREQGWRWRVTQTFGSWPWALSGPSAASRGWVALSEGRPHRISGGWLAAWGHDRWEQITPTIQGLTIWDATPWRNGLILGCSVGEGQYLDEWSGRLVLVQGQDWRLVNLPAMAGAIRVTSINSWPGRLWITTAWGEIWWTDDLEHFTLWHREDYGRQRNAFLYEIGGSLVVSGARGKVWVYSNPEAVAQLVVDIQETEFMSLSPVKLPNNDWCLAGPMTMNGATNSRPVVISPE